ncbi:glutamic acid-rich protein-like [Cynara cardunculus var. scolymus]|uniref:glutamic acid-rich protein-like n=1 Tax=Cynara cardunculus var. scolymus TaxID=59895 RepID=UPI000D625E6B|nr:glutamic acid-rich protein-like [Cynara cardunculus var. scolymus]
MQVAVQANVEAICALTSKADETHSHLAQQRKVMKKILTTLQQPIPTAELSFTVDDREQLHPAREANVIMAFGPSDAAAAIPATKAEAEASIAEAEASIAEAEAAAVVDDSPASYEVPVAKDVDVARTEAPHEDPPVTSTADGGDLDDEYSDDEDDDESPDLPDIGKDLDDDDDEDDDDDDFTIHCGEFDLLTDAERLEALKADEELELQRKQTEDSLKLAKSLAAKILSKRKSKKKVTAAQAQAKLLSVVEAERKNLKLAERDERWSEASINKRISPHPIKSVNISGRSKDSGMLLFMLIPRDNL